MRYSLSNLQAFSFLLLLALRPVLAEDIHTCQSVKGNEYYDS